jgi:hypothetical protein
MSCPNPLQDSPVWETNSRDGAGTSGGQAVAPAALVDVTIFATGVTALQLTMRSEPAQTG